LPACSSLTAAGYGDPNRVAIEGGFGWRPADSGAVTNLAPEKFVPFIATCQLST